MGLANKKGKKTPEKKTKKKTYSSVLFREEIGTIVQPFLLSKGRYREQICVA